MWTCFLRLPPVCESEIQYLKSQLLILFSFKLSTTFYFTLHMVENKNKVEAIASGIFKYMRLSETEEFHLFPFSIQTLTQ